MNMKKILIGTLFIAFALNILSGIAQADSLKIAIMQDKKGAVI